MSTCPQCGAPATPGQAFCGVCGGSLAAVAEDRTVIRPATPEQPAAPTAPPAPPTQPPAPQWAPPTGGAGVNLDWLIKGNWLGALGTAGVAFGVALVFSALIAFTTMQDFDFVSGLWATFLLTGATFGADIVAGNEDFTVWTGQVPVLGTVLALGAAVVVFGRATKGYARWLPAIVDAVRASLFLSVILLVMGIGLKIASPEITAYTDPKGDKAETELVGSAADLEYPEREYVETDVEYPEYPDYPDYPDYDSNQRAYDKAMKDYEAEYDRLQQEYETAVEEYEAAQAEAEEKQEAADAEYEEAVEEYEEEAEAAEEKAEENEDLVGISSAGRTGLLLGQNGHDTGIDTVSPDEDGTYPDTDEVDDDELVTATSSIPGLIFLSFFLLLAVLLLASFVRRDWLDRYSAKAHDWVAVPLRAFGVLILGLTAAGLIYVAAVMIGQEESRSLAHAVSMLAVLPALGLRLLALGIGGSFGSDSDGDLETASEWVHLAGFAEVHGGVFWIALVVPWILAALVALTIAKKAPERPWGALGNLGVFSGLALVILPILVRLSNYHVSIDADDFEGSGIFGIGGAGVTFLFALAVGVVGLVILAATGKIDLGKVKSAASSLQSQPGQAPQWGAPPPPPAPPAPPVAPPVAPPTPPPAQGWEPPAPPQG